ncbi:MAG TPA: T9SS type A sorting domain-containing protein, partial [Candidatus Kapabacteria bacterium]|nr:T9SS type A sorting domain-containing protein [Candidatus Kapabacteria bacterium]
NNAFAGDTVTSGPIDLTGKSNVYLTLSYQRGLKTDIIEAGILKTLRVGPESAITGTTPDPADSLVVEGLISSGSRWNPAASSWTVLHTLTGGIDVKTNKLRIKLPSNMMSDHFRLRLRLKSRDHGNLFSLPHDDADSWVIDGIQLNAPSNGQTEFEIIASSLGAGDYTRVPRDVRFLKPTVRLANNGQNAGLGSFNLRTIITDQLGREVYHKTQGFAFPVSFGDTTIQMQAWDIKGSQGGVFTLKSYVESNFSEIYRANDTNITTRALIIGDAYALDDNQPDTVGNLTKAPQEWYYDFVPLTDDSLRAVDFFFLEPQGATSWQLEFRRGAILLGTRNFSVTPSERGWIRASFAPLNLPFDPIRVHVTQTVGTPIGGDASRGLIFQTVSGTTPSFSPLFPEIVEDFTYANNTPFYGGAATLANGGVLIPMMRFVYSGSLNYLPVELIRFAGERHGENVELNWRTASEENSRGFTIERQDGDNWLFIADVEARNSKLGGSYFAQDRLAPSTELSYRLTEQDLDGSTKVIGHVKIGAVGTGAVEIRVYPNPAVNTIGFHVNGAMPENVVLMDALGREVKRAFGVTELAVSDLSAGTYFLHVEANGQTYVRSVAITR